MVNLRIKTVKIIDSSNIDVKFTDSLTSNLIASNISIISETPNAPDSAVLEIRIMGDLLSINCQPLTSQASYYIIFKSAPMHPFESLNGTSAISEDGVSNRFLIIGPLESNNPIKNYLEMFLHDNIYSDDDSSVVKKYIKSLAITLSRALYDIRQVKNENYLSFNIQDEPKIRGTGPFDRLNEEGAYAIARVGRTVTGTNAKTRFSFDNFPSDPISLQKQNYTESLLPNSINDNGIFNTSTLVLNLSNSPIIKINSIVFTLNTANPVYTYDITRLGYHLKSSRYDQQYGFSYAQLSDNQVKISDALLSDASFSLRDVISVSVSYESKNLGTVVDASSVIVYSTLSSIREVLPPLSNVFSLKHSMITDSSNKIPTLNEVSFTDPDLGSSTQHPAFINEITFRLNALPFMPGQYSIDYETGKVYVYGSDITNDGTGAYPALATYKYRHIHKSEIDYSYDLDSLDIVALPGGSLVDTKASINFDYEEVLVPGIDYKASLHSEALNERIDNKLIALNVLKTKNSPITNVFRIYNETSGEIYNLDRWNDDKIYFRYNNPPRIVEQIAERASFNTINNESLVVNNVFNISPSNKIYKILLFNNTIIAATEDSIASCINTSLVFSDGYIFSNEKWFNRDLSEAINLNRLQNRGEYMVDYDHGIIFVVVSTAQNFNIGTASYKNNLIVTQLPHIISIENIYYRINSLSSKNKSFSYTSFNDNEVSPDILDHSDELFLNNSSSTSYQLFNNEAGVFLNTTFSPGVTNQIKFIRSIFEYNDLLNNSKPINFSQSSVANDFNITVSPSIKGFLGTVQYDGSNFFVTINEDISYLSPNITYTFSVNRLSDGYALWDNLGSVVLGDPVKLILSGANLPVVGDHVSIGYNFSINNLSRLVIDYNKGDYFIDYTYLNDEIIVSYEYGDNVLDFRENTNLPAGTEYFVSYKAGALRDALLKNFGTLVNLPELAVFDIDFNRERYREALMAALSSFVQGPTVAAIKNIGKVISHISPQISESAFLNWSLGSSLLTPEKISTTGAFELLSAKYNNGVFINSDYQSISYPINSNLRLEEGTFETWIIPQWKGLDNQSSLTFNITKDGYTISSNDIFIGASEYHPIIDNGYFTLNKESDVQGRPNHNKDGVFIYYDSDVSNKFDRWFIRVIDGYVDGYSSNYKFKITSTGSFYDSKSIVLPKPSNLNIFTGTKSLTFSLVGNAPLDSGITFLSDQEHYILDFGEAESKSRMSIYKDASGYFNFRVFDKNKASYTISANVSEWAANELHHIAASWKLNNTNNRDEMHFFIDGFEVPNITKFGQKTQHHLHEKFRTINNEEIIGLTNRDIVSSIDLHTIAGTALVTSSLNFSSYNIFPGDVINIEESGFLSSGYSILAVAGQTLTLDSAMPFTLNDARFSINKTTFNITTDIDTFSNMYVSVIHALIRGTDATGVAGSSVITSSITNFSAANVMPGFSIRIDNPNLPTTYNILQVSTNSITIDSNLPINISSTPFQVYSNDEIEIPGQRATRPSYSVSKDGYFNNILTVFNNVYAEDLILVRTLGLISRGVKKQYYVWSSNQENVLMTQLPAPISLDEAKITKVILPAVSIGASNSTVVAGAFLSNNLPTDPITNAQNGRTISITAYGNNVDFSSPITVTINGVVGVYTINETIIFTDYGIKDTVNKFISINYIKVTVKPINSSKDAFVIAAKEKYSITRSEASGLVPVVRYAYHMGGGYTLQSDGYGQVRDDNFLFSGLDINNTLLIHTPISVAGFYTITALSPDRKSISIQPTSQATSLPLPIFSNAKYQVLNVNAYRSGLQNGFFTLEGGSLPTQAYFLERGFYELEYSTYARIQLDPFNGKMFLGTDFNGKYNLNGVMDQVKIYSTMLTDTRVGESIPANQRSITKDFNSIKELKADDNTLSLINFDSFPFVNSAKFYTNYSENKHHFQSTAVINENFGSSTVISNDPIILYNDGILDTRKQGTIEFWMSPLFDTANDPNVRYYFDAFGAVVEEAVSINNTSIKLTSPASKILSVKLRGGNSSIDYFAGGKIEIDTQRAIQENVISTSNSSVTVSKPALQIISIKIVGDFSETDYFAGGSIASNQSTIYLGRVLPSASLPLVIVYQTTENKNTNQNSQIIRLNTQLPNQNSSVVVSYIPQGLQGDRISIFKDMSGYMNFSIMASGISYVVRAPTRWSRSTWHRIKASYKMNSGKGKDELRLFLDGYQYNNVKFGATPTFGSFPLVYGASSPGGSPNDGYGFIENIRFKDPINHLFIGSQFTGESPIFSLLDNLRISDVSRPIYAPYGEPLDINYNSNLETVFPVTEDLFSTYIMNFNKIKLLNDDFAILKNRQTGIFDFSVNILDSFGIVDSSVKSKEVLEKLIKVLKPANSRVFITYTK